MFEELHMDWSFDTFAKISKPGYRLFCASPYTSDCRESHSESMNLNQIRTCNTCSSLRGLDSSVYLSATDFQSGLSMTLNVHAPHVFTLMLQCRFLIALSNSSERFCIQKRLNEVGKKRSGERSQNQLNSNHDLHCLMATSLALWRSNRPSPIC